MLLEIVQLMYVVSPQSTPLVSGVGPLLSAQSSLASLQPPPAPCMYARAGAFPGGTQTGGKI